MITLYTRKKSILKALKLILKGTKIPHSVYDINYRYRLANQIHDLMEQFNIKGHIVVDQMIVYNQLDEHQKQKISKIVKKLKLDALKGKINYEKL